MSTPSNITFDDGFHQTDFINSLNFVLNKSTPSLQFIRAGVTQDFPNVSSTTIQNLFNSYLQTYTTPSGQTFSSWADFKDKWYTFATSQGFSPTTKTQLYQTFLAAYMQSLGNSLSPDLRTLSGDWTILQNPPDSFHFDFTTDTSVANPFVQMFNRFANDFTYPPQASVTDFTGYFINQLTPYLTTTALLQDPSQAVVPPGQPANFFIGIPAYATIYQAFGPSNATAADFIGRLQQFYIDQVQKKGAFIPSQDFSDWVQTIGKENNFNVASPSADTSSLAGNSAEKVIIINRIIVLLISMIQTLQGVGVAQAGRLRFTTAFQQAYVALQTQIPTFVRGSPGAIGSTSSDATQVRNDLNASFNSILTDNLRSLRGLQEDRAKQQESNVNQTNDAVNQQTDMATTMLQELSTLLSTILR